MEKTYPVNATLRVWPTADNPTHTIPALIERVLSATAVAACIGLLLYKLVLVRLINANWDEFAFLNLVYERSRGELTALMGGFTHLFAWLPSVPGNEVDQIVAARYVMVALLIVTAWLIWRLARIWLQGFAALVPVFVYLSMMPVLEHGGSFRFDSMLAPLSVAPLVLLLAPGFSPRRDWLAGALLGVGFAVSVKVVLFAPAIAMAVMFGRSGNPSRIAWRAAMLTLVRVGLAATLVAAALIGLHWLAISPVPQDSVTGFAGTAARKTLVDVPWFPRLDYFARAFSWQPFLWLLMGFGAISALVRRRFAIAALGLSLLPLAIYRNAFPYYYVVMLAPASVLAGYAVAELWSYVRARRRACVATLLIVAVWVGALIDGLRHTTLLAFDDQVVQRKVIAAVHQIFPEPVNYIDRCGMVSSFRKVNFFMSTWGMEDYRATGEPFLPRALRDHKPAFVLMNTSSLNPQNTGRYGMLPEDRTLLGKYYVGYWGPIGVAGAHALLESPSVARMTVPFAADYRLVIARPVLVDGILRSNGDVIAVSVQGVAVARAPGDGGEALQVLLLLASARPPPTGELAPGPVFRGL